MVELSGDQKIALSHVLDWYRKDRGAMPYVTLGGYAGTGKTTLIAQIRKELARIDPGLKTGFVSYTGKAARVLREKLISEQAVFPKDSVSTIHALIYTPLLNAREEIIGWKKKDGIDRDLIVIDEASMVDEEIWNHLASYRVPMVVVGDHGQLPPIRGNFYLMKSPDLTLTSIHRQAKGNPIIAMSVHARESGHIPVGRYGRGTIKYAPDDPETQEAMQELLNAYTPDMLILCGYNVTRNRLNAHVRQSLGFDTAGPASGDRVICLRNNHKERIYNGMLGAIHAIRHVNDYIYEAEIILDGEDRKYAGHIAKEQFGASTALNFSDQRKRYHAADLFDFGYAITVHKAQGSQARRVLLIEERFSKMDDEAWRRWLYTGVTRAEEELFVFPQLR